MPATIDFLFDFGSPNGYLAWKVLPGIAERTGAKVNIVPVLLGGLFKLTNNRSPVEAYAGIKNKLAYEGLETKRFVARHGLSAYRSNPHFPVNTLLIMRGLVAARRMGVGDRYLEAVVSAMWEQGLKMDDPAIVRDVLGKAGLDADAILAATQEPEVKAELMANTEAAAARGAFGVPTFFVGEEMFFGKDRLEQVEEAARETVAA